MLKTLFSCLLTVGLAATLYAQTLPAQCIIQATIGVSICIDPPGCVVFGVNITNGTGPYTYNWSNGSTLYSIGFPGSSYQYTCETVTVTDHFGCVAITGDVFQFPSPPANFTVLPDTFFAAGIPLDFDVSLNDQHDAGEYELVQPPVKGALVFNSDGSGTYTPDMAWCGPDYFRYLFKDTSCNYSQIVNVTVFNGPCAQLLTQKTDCNNACSGTAVFYQNGLLTPPLSYLWSNGQTAAEAAGLCAGPVSVTVTDALGTEEVYQSVVDAGSLDAAIAGVTESCRNVRVLLQPQVNADPPGNLSYEWGNVSTFTKYDTTQLIFPGQPGNTTPYQLIVRSAAGCVDTAFHLIEVFPTPNIQSITAQPVICPNDTIHLTAKVNSGTPPYAYHWTGPLGVQASTPELVWTNVNPAWSGSYRLTVSDVNGCISKTSKNVNIPASLAHTVTAYGSTQTLCQGSDLMLNYGMSPNWVEKHTVEWTGPNGFFSTERNPVLQNLTPAMAGTYTVTVFFGNNCSASGSTTVILSNNVAAVTSLQIVPPASCTIYDGKATVTMSVPPPYSVSATWGGGAQNFNTNPFTVNNVRPGDFYSLTITANSCKVIQNLDTPYPSPPTILATDETCTGGGTGTVMSPNPLKSVSWYNANFGTKNGASVTDLAAATYTVTIKDSLTNCTFSEKATVNPYLQFEVAVIDTPGCQDMTGSLQAIALGVADPPVTYSWSNGFSGEHNQDLAYGWYSVTMTDGAGCKKHQNTFLPADEACFALITGRVFVNHDCVCMVDNNDYPYPNLLVCAENGTYKDCTFTDNTGAYYLTAIPPGQYTLSVYPKNSYLQSACAPQTVDVSDITTDVTGVDFFFCSSPVTDYSIDACCGFARPGFPQTYRFKISNRGTVTNDTALVTVDLNDQLDVNQINPTPVSFDPATNQISWQVANIPLNSFEYFIVKTTVNANLGDVLETTGTVTTNKPDSDLSNNTTFCQVVVTGSYDPNDKTANLVKATVTDSMLTYTIRFQNSGTDTAFTVIVRDTLDAAVFDLRSVQPVMSSHPYRLDVESDNILVFIFENILLPDSNLTVEGSKGFAMFDIRLKAGLPVGTVINNSAAIYFDYNAPVITNTTETTIVNPGCPLPDAPDISQSGAIPLCEGESITLTATACPGCEVAWSDGQTTPAITVSSPGIFTAIASNDCGSSLASAAVEVTFFSAPASPVVSASGATTLCEGQSLTLTVTNICSSCTVTWSNGETAEFIQVTMPGDYSATFSIPANPAGCKTSATSNVISVNEVVIPPVPVVVSSGPTALCQGQSVTLTATNICNGCTVNWSNGEFGESITVSEPGAYSSVYTNDCGEGEMSATIEVTAFEFVPEITLVNPCQLEAAAGSNYQWFLNDTLLQGQTGQFLTVTANGNYSVSMLNPDGCTGTSGPVLVENCATAVVDKTGAFTLLVYPNPAAAFLNFELNLLHSSAMKLELFAIDGRLVTEVFDRDLAARKHLFSVDTEGWSSGVYFYRITGGKGTVTGKVVMSR